MAFHGGKICLHAAAAFVMAFGYMNLHTLEIDTWVHTQYGGHFQFLTIQGLVVAWITMMLALFLDIFSFFQGLRSIKRALIMVALPLSVTISAIYWPLIVLFPTLILQKQHPESSIPSSSEEELALFRIPLSLDLSLHAAPALTLMADFFLFETKYSTKALRTMAPSLLIIFTTWYSWWAERCAKHNGGIFPYPFLTENPIEIRVAIYIGASALAYTSFRLMNGLHR